MTLPPLSYSSQMLIASLLSLDSALGNLPWPSSARRLAAHVRLLKTVHWTVFLTRSPQFVRPEITRVILSLALRAVITVFRHSNLFQKDLSRSPASKQCFDFEVHPLSYSSQMLISISSLSPNPHITQRHKRNVNHHNHIKTMGKRAGIKNFPKVAYA